MILTSSYPSADSDRATPGAWPSPTSSTSHVVRARAARSSCRPCPTSATEGSQSRTSAWRDGSSSAWTYGGFETDEVPARLFLGGLEAALAQREPQSEALPVLPGEREGVRGDVDGSHARARMLVRDRQGNRPGTDADVEHARLLEPCEQRQAALDDDLRLGARDERTRVRPQRQPPKAPLAEDVRERLAGAAAAEQLPHLLELRLLEWTVELGVQLDPREPERVRDQVLRVDPRRVHALVGEEVGRAAEDLAERQAAPRTFQPSARAAPACRSSNVTNAEGGPACAAAPRWSASSVFTPCASAIAAAASQVR